MLKSMLALGRMQFRQYNIYKSNFYLFTLNRIVEIVVYIFVWQAIYNETGDSGGYSISEMVTYYILVFTLSSLACWGVNEDMAHSIRNGNINKELLNPLTYFQYYFGINLGEMGFASVTGIATFIICTLLWGITFPVSIVHFLLFIFVILLGIPITFFFTVIFGMFGFYSSSVWGMQILRKAIVSIFSGIIAPITLFPEWFQAVANVLPFKELIYTPINIWLGQVSISQIGLIIMKQIVWIFVLYIIAKVFFNHAIKKVTINGG